MSHRLRLPGRRHCFITGRSCSRAGCATQAADASMRTLGSTGCTTSAARLLDARRSAAGLPLLRGRRRPLWLT
eukprot:1255298-Alexandrium_andersonii.AAC.1